MLKLFKYFLWVVVILALTIGFDQLMVNVPLKAPGLKETQVFYVDFRSRLIGLFNKEAAPQKDRIGQVIEKSDKAITKPAAKPTRYLYVDENGTLQFADTLQQVPNKYRQDAQPLAE